MFEADANVDPFLITPLLKYIERDPASGATALWEHAAVHPTEEPQGCDDLLALEPFDIEELSSEISSEKSFKVLPLTPPVSPPERNNGNNHRASMNGGSSSDEDTKMDFAMSHPDQMQHHNTPNDGMYRQGIVDNVSFPAMDFLAPLNSLREQQKLRQQQQLQQQQQQQRQQQATRVNTTAAARGSTAQRRNSTTTTSTPRSLHNKIKTAAAADDSGARKQKQTAHNAIERKYRNNINEKINDLKRALPPHLAADPKTKKKAGILQKCIEYIRQLEKANQQLSSENQMLRSGSARSGSSSSSKGASSATAPQQTTTSATDMRLTPGGSKVVMCVMALGTICFSSMLPGGAQESAGGGVMLGAGHSGSRVLSSFHNVIVGDEGAEDYSTTIGAEPSYSLVGWVIAIVSPWIFRIIACLVILVVMFTRDSLTDPKGAAEHEQKCAVAVVNGNPVKAKHHALKALALLGQPIPVSSLDVGMSVLAASCRQLWHRLFIGQYIDAMLASDEAKKIFATSANVNHILHELLSQEKSVPDSLKYLSMVRALNAAEIAGEGEMDPVALIRVYVSAAVQIHVSFQGDLASVLSGKYIAKARKIFHSCPEDVPTLAWLFKPEGDNFFFGRTWNTRNVLGLHGEFLRPGSLEQLGTAYRSTLLQQGLREFCTGKESDRAMDMFGDLRQCSQQCGDFKSEWWATIGVVILAWRQGKNGFARQTFCDAENMAAHKTKLQQFVYLSCRAQQALLDGDHTLCWQALSLASSLAEDVSDGRNPEEAEISKLAVFVGYHHLMSARVALVRLRTYLTSNASVKLPDISTSKDAPPVSITQMLNSLEEDVCRLRQYSEQCTLAKPAAHLYQAIHRCLAGGKVSLTERVFHQSVRAARRLELPYDEASAMLHSAIYLRPTLTAPALKKTLTTAAGIFEKLQAADELSTARKLLMVMP